LITKAVEKALKGTIIVQVGGDGIIGREELKSSNACLNSMNGPSNILSKLIP
jgi:hypothetical protein